MKRHCALVIAAALVLLSLSGPTARGAFQERDIVSEINATVAVLRYLHRAKDVVEEKFEMIRNTRELTEKQIKAQSQIVAEEQRKKAPNTIKLEVYKIDMATLKRQNAKLKRTNLEKTYAARMVALNNTIARYRTRIEAKLLEFRVHFGKEPHVNLDFESRVSRFRQKQLGLAYLTIY